MMESVARVARVVKDEEHRYATTFQVAEKVFNDEVKSLRGRPLLPGAVAFKLYDTYGLALDEQEDMARELGLAIDRDGFEQRDGEAARTRARELEGRGEGAVAPAYQELLANGRTEFVGYETLETHARVAGILVSQQPVTKSVRVPKPKWCWIRRRSTPRPADRWATRACSSRNPRSYWRRVESALMSHCPA